MSVDTPQAARARLEILKQTNTKTLVFFYFSANNNVSQCSYTMTIKKKKKSRGGIKNEKKMTKAYTARRRP